MKSFSAFSLFLAILLVGSTAAAQRPVVLVINSYHAEYSWVVAHNSALKKALENNADLFFFDMDTKRLPRQQHPVQGAAALMMIKQVDPDVVVLTDDNALRLLCSSIPENIPIVYLGINANPREYMADMTNVTGVLERPLMKRSIFYLKNILGEGFSKCLVLFDDSRTAEAVMETVFHGRSHLDFAMTTTDIRLLKTYAEWKQQILEAGARGYQAIIVGLYHTIVDANGTHVDPEEIIQWTSSHTPVPIFGFWDFSIGKGKAVGGLIHFGRDQGKAAANLVLQILNGASPVSVQPVMAEQGHFVFSRSELKRWGIDLTDKSAQIPPVDYVD